MQNVRNQSEGVCVYSERLISEIAEKLILKNRLRFLPFKAT